MKQKLCTHCERPLKEARLVVHSAIGLSGEFHLGGCYEAALAKRGELAPPWHRDIESVVPVEGITASTR